MPHHHVHSIPDARELATVLTRFEAVKETVIELIRLEEQAHREMESFRVLRDDRLSRLRRQLDLLERAMFPSRVVP